MLNRVEVELPSASDVAKANDIELQDITENATKSTEDLITQFEEQQTLPMHELLGLDKQLRSIKGLLKVEVAQKVQLEQHIEWERCKLAEIENPQEYGNDQCEEIRNRTEKLSDDLKVRQESIDLLKGRLMNQITTFK